jgi:hypothetical protein
VVRKGGELAVEERGGRVGGMDADHVRAATRRGSSRIHSTFRRHRRSVLLLDSKTIRRGGMVGLGGRWVGRLSAARRVGGVLVEVRKCDQRGPNDDIRGILIQWRGHHAVISLQLREAKNWQDADIARTRPSMPH